MDDLGTILVANGLPLRIGASPPPGMTLDPAPPRVPVPPPLDLGQPTRPVHTQQLERELVVAVPDLGDVHVVMVGDRLHVDGALERHRPEVEQVIAAHVPKPPPPRSADDDRIAALEARVAALEQKSS